MPDGCDDTDEVVCILTPRLPGGLDVVIDDQPGSFVIWVRKGLTPEEVVDRIARGCSEVARARLWTRTPMAGKRLREAA